MALPRNDDGTLPAYASSRPTATRTRDPLPLQR